MSEESGEKIQRIEDVNALVQALVHKETLGKPFWLSGIAQAVHYSDQGNTYFRLENNRYSIYCYLPDRLRGEMDFTIQPHMELEVFGDIRVWQPQARLQIQAQKIRLIEISLVADFKGTEEYLRSKGLFPKTPLPLPNPILKIMLITSTGSRAVDDFRAAYFKAGGTAEVDVYDVPLEGESAPRKIAEALYAINDGSMADVIVLTRGGGSTRSLAVFNDPMIAEAICRSKIPIVSAIGHERDIVFADKVADKRASTPTDAATLLLNAQKSKSKSCFLLASSFLVILSSLFYLSLGL